MIVIVLLSCIQVSFNIPYLIYDVIYFNVLHYKLYTCVPAVPTELDVDLDDIITNLSAESIDQIRQRRTIGSFDLLSGIGSLFGSYLFNQLLGGVGGLFNGFIRGGL